MNSPEDDSKNLISPSEDKSVSITMPGSPGDRPKSNDIHQYNPTDSEEPKIEATGITELKSGLYPNLEIVENSNESEPLNPEKNTQVTEKEASADKNSIEVLEKELVPPDGGWRAWLVMTGSFLCNGIIFGTINSCGVIFTKLKKIFEDKGVENPASYASLTLSLAIGTTFFLSMVAGVLTDRFGIRLTTIAGGILATIGVFISSLYYTQEGVLVFSFGIIFGTGASLAYTPSLVILGHYFRKYIGIVNGIVTAGSSIFTILLSWLVKKMILIYGLKAAFLMLSAFMAVLIFCGIIFKPYLPIAKQSNNSNIRPGDVSFRAKCHKFFGQFINFEIWRNKRYVIWTFAIPSALFGYFVPYVHLVEYARTVLQNESLPENLTSFTPPPLNVSLHEFELFSTSLAPANSSNGTNTNPTNHDPQTQILVQCIALTSLFGRLLFGFLADRPGVNRILLQQISFFCIGSLTMLLTLANSFWVFVIITLGMGLFDGCFISLLGPIAIDIVGPDGASQAIGCLLAMCSIPLTLGPYIAGVMEDHLDSYIIPFLCAGIPPILGCFALCLLKCVDEPPKSTPMSLQQKKEMQDVEKKSMPEAETLIQGDPLHVSKQEEDPVVDIKSKRS